MIYQRYMIYQSSAQGDLEWWFSILIFGSVFPTIVSSGQTSFSSGKEG